MTTNRINNWPTNWAELAAEKLGHAAGEGDDVVYVVSLLKDQERYMFLFDQPRRPEALRRAGRFASNPELSFTWYDAAVLGKKICEAEGTG